MSNKLELAVEKYLSELRTARSLGAGVRERSFYPILADLLNDVGHDLKPTVLCLSELADTGAGHPDFGLFTKTQCQKGEPRPGQKPERGVVEVKSVADDAWRTAETRQVSRYWDAYRLVLVTNYRDFLLIGEDHQGRAAKLEEFRLALSEAEFWEKAAAPRKTAKDLGNAFGEYLKRALTLSVSLREPKDVAWFLASYARDALQRVDEAGDVPALAAVRQAFEEALGIAFEGDKGDHFFRSSLVQTLFYGVFSAWALWVGQPERRGERFDWRTAVWHLKVPMLRALFQQLADPGKLEPLRLVEVLDWTANTLNRVVSEEFFARFNDAEAVQFFYEPFLQAFDPELRKQLGVWYTPTEVVSYMVARVDLALKQDLGVEDGLAAYNVYILDPCCGTGAYLAAVLRRIETTLEDRGLGAMQAQAVKKAATSRVFGFEIMPAPFVVAHLQIGLLLQQLGAPLADETGERAGVYLTNALTGWEPEVQKPLPFPELEEERKRADAVKQDVPILVILGNPPYNGYAGVAMHEERALSDAYRTTRRVRRPEGQGLNDLYVRFYRMAERRIAEKTGRGVICFISNYSWLDGLSFTGMRERYLEAFDRILIDNLHGDRIISEYAPDGRSSDTIFAVRGQSTGIKVGTAISTLIKRPEDSGNEADVWYRDFHQSRADDRRAALVDSFEGDALTGGYTTLDLSLPLGLPFKQTSVGADYLCWPRLPDLFPASFPGVQSKRDSFVVDIDIQSLNERIRCYFNTNVEDADVFSMHPEANVKTSQYDPKKTRHCLLERGLIEENFVKYLYKPFDVRWIYWDPDCGLLSRRSPDFFHNSLVRNVFIELRQRQSGEFFSRGTFSSILSDNFGNGFSNFFPLYLRPHDSQLTSYELRPNISKSVGLYLSQFGLGAEVLFFCALATLHSALYRAENAAALRMDWPRVPVPENADTLKASGDLGQELAALLDPETPLPGITTGSLRGELRLLAVPAKVGGGGLTEPDFVLTAGWGSTQKGGIVMPGRGKPVPRDYRPDEIAAFAAASDRLGLTIEQILGMLGETTVDVYLNADAYWANIPAKVWAYTLGGYQVIKKWLSYRERDVLGRALKPEEVTYVAEMARRIAAILLMGPRLDANYMAVKRDAAPPPN